MIKARRISALLLAAALLLGCIPQALAVGEQIHSYEPIRTGDPRIDSLADELLKQIPTDGKTDAQKIQAVYDWIIRNCVRDGWDGTTWFDEAQVSAAADALARDPNYQAQILRPEFKAERTPGDLPGMYLYDYDSNAYIAAFAYEMMYKRCGNCAHFAALLTVLLTRLGYDCRLIDGVFVNNDGSTYEHKWNYVLVDGQYYWLDVRMDHAGYARTGSISLLFPQKRHRRMGPVAPVGTKLQRLADGKRGFHCAHDRQNSALGKDFLVGRAVSAAGGGTGTHFRVHLRHRYDAEHDAF